MLVLLVCLALPPAALGAPPVGRPPVDDVARWTDLKERSGANALPIEARLLYRQAVLARRDGRWNDATRLARGAEDLDPTFVEPRLTLARWLLLREPGQALQQVAGLVETLRRDFAAQWALTANGLHTLARAWFVTWVVAGLLLLLFRHAELRHALQERLATWASRPAAGVWAWVLLIFPFVLGFGVVLPLIGFLALLWPVLRARERVVVVACLTTAAALPFAQSALDRLAAPMRDGEVAARLLALESGAGSVSGADREESARWAAEAPDDPGLQFASAWVARRDGDFAAAEAAYRRVLELWPDDPRSLNNLGNVLALQQRYPEAIDSYRRAAAADSGDATALLNLSRALTHEFDFDGAHAALSRATALDFDFVRAHPEPTGGGVPRLVDRWIEPARLWQSVRSAPVAGDPVPGFPRRSAHPGYVAAVLLVAAAGFAVGHRWQGRLPLARCRNCGRVVCRRCARRRNAEALCAACASVEAGAPSPAFSAVLLQRERTRRHRPRRVAETVLALLVPGAGLMAHRRVFRALILLFLAALVWVAAAGEMPYAGRPRLGFGETHARGALAVLLLPVYLLSLLGYWRETAGARARTAADARGGPRRRPGLRVRDGNDEMSREAA